MDETRQGAGERARHVAVAPRPLPKSHRIDFEFHKVADGCQSVTKEKPRAFECAEKVADHGKVATLDAGEEQSRPAGLINPALDLGHLEVRVNLLVDADQSAGAFQVGDARAEVAVSHAMNFLPAKGKAVRQGTYVII